MTATWDMTWGEVKKEMRRAVDLHGPLPSDPERALRILVEEVGEAAKDIERIVHPDRDLIHPDRGEAERKAKQDLLAEVIQVAATAVQWANNLQEELR